MFFSIFLITKPRFLQEDGISYTLETTSIFGGMKETFITSSLLVSRKNLNFHPNVTWKSWIILICLLCGDIEVNPGPCNPTELLNLLKQKGNHIFHQNIRGLFSKLELIEEFLHRSQNIHILTLSETHITTTTNDAIYEIPGFAFVNKSGKGGGVAAYISNNMSGRNKLTYVRTYADRDNFHYVVLTSLFIRT